MLIHETAFPSGNRPPRRSGKTHAARALLLPLLLAACAGPALDIRPPGSGVAEPQQAATVPPAAPVVETKPATPEKPAGPGTAPVVTQQLAALPAPPAAIVTSPLDGVPPASGQPRIITAGGTVKVAVLLPLGARDASLRQDAAELRDAAQMALFEQKNPGLSLTFLDTLGTPEGAAQAARQAVADGAQVMLGPLLRESVTAAAPIARAAGIPVLAFSNDARLAGNGVFIMGQSPAVEVARIVDFGMKQGLLRFASIAPRNAYGQLVTESMLQEVTRRGGSITRMVYYNPQALDFSRTILPLQPPEIPGAAKVKTASGQKTPRQKPDFDAVLLPALSGQVLRTLAAQLAQLDIDQPQVRFLGLSPWNGFTGLDSEPPLIGAWFVSPAESDARNSFATNFGKYYQRQPGPLAALAHDGLAMVAQLVADSGNNSMLAAAGGSTVVPDTRNETQFSPSGLMERPLAIRGITRRGSNLVDPPRLPQGAAVVTLTTP